jgi:amino acid permease
MPEKDPENVSWLLQLIPMLFATGLAALGGMVQYFNKIDKNGVPFSAVKLLIEVGTSGFVGIVSFELCDAAGFSWQLTAALVAISGHMGARALVLIENQVVRRFTNDNSEREVESTEEANH